MKEWSHHHWRSRTVSFVLAGTQVVVPCQCSWVHRWWYLLSQDRVWPGKDRS